MACYLRVVRGQLSRYKARLRDGQIKPLCRYDGRNVADNTKHLEHTRALRVGSDERKSISCGPLFRSPDMNFLNY